MSELKAIRSGEIYNIIEYEDCYRTDDLYYPKSEADNVIAEKDAEIARLKDIRKVHVEAIESMEAGLLQDDDEIRRQKYKRCLAMARWCRTSARCDEGLGAFKYRDWYWKWFKRWMKLAEKFKDKEA